VKIPKRLKILGHDVKVLYPYSFKEREDIWGQWDQAGMVIRLAGVDNGGQKIKTCAVVVTLLEEIIHAIDDLQGHKIFHNDEVHKALPGLTNGMYQVLKDNGYL
jgi:hypothetical protein